jgi:beta-glucanase (GH16 family)
MKTTQIAFGLILLTSAAQGQGSCVWVNNLIDGWAPLNDQCPCAQMPYVGGWDLCQYDSWKLVFNDEFTGAALNTDNWDTWSPLTSDGLPSELHSRAPENNQQIYWDDNVVVSDGTVKLITKHETTTWFGVTRPYTSGMIFSKSPYAFTKGRFDIRCKLPSTYGSDLIWPAFWAWGPTPNNPAVGPTEIDVFEFCGYDWTAPRSDLHRELYCYNSEGIGASNTWNSNIDFSSSFHVFSVVWDDFFVKWYVDGTLIRSYCPLITLSGDQVGSDICGQAAIGNGIYWWSPAFPEGGSTLSIIANTAIAMPESTYDDTFCKDHEDMDLADFPCEFEIDYIRVYQRNPQPGLSDLCSVPRGVQGPSSLCTTTTPMQFTVSGSHGELTWDVSSNITIVSQDHNSVWVTSSSDPIVDGWGFINAHDQFSPCDGAAQTYTRAILVHEMDVIVTDYHEDNCATPILCVTVPSSEHVSTFWIEGQLQSETWYNGWVPFAPGSNCLAYHTTPGDFCFDYQIDVAATCGSEQTVLGVLQDECVFGPCDLADPVGPDDLTPFVHVSPVPAVTEFDIAIGEEIDLNILSKIEVRDAMMNEKFSVIEPSNRTNTVNCANWPSGVYYVMVVIDNQQVLTKIEIK